jgi:hypothetical protein
MNARTVVGLVFSLLLLVVGGNLRAADVYAVHAIPGQDLGLDPALPVDVNVVGVGCAIKDFRFGTIAGPLSLPAGKYELEIRLANAEAPCTGVLAVPATVYLSVVENASIVAHLTEQGTPTVTKFVNDVRSMISSDARLSVRHTAALPAVDVELRKGDEVTGVRYTAASHLVNGQQSTLDVNAGTYFASIFPADSVNRSLGPLQLTLDPGFVYIGYAVGSARTGSASVLLQAFPLK